MNDKVKHRATLPESLMEALAAVAASDMTVPAKAEATILMVQGVLLLDEATGIDPSAYEIPQPQWTTIAQGLIDAQQEPIGAVNGALTWMNYGPSAYEAEEVHGG